MRYIVIVLLIANIAALLWFRFGPASRELVPSETEVRVPAPLINTGLLKVSERDL